MPAQQHVGEQTRLWRKERLENCRLDRAVHAAR